MDESEVEKRKRAVLASGGAWNEGTKSEDHTFRLMMMDPVERESNGAMFLEEFVDRVATPPPSKRSPLRPARLLLIRGSRQAGPCPSPPPNEF